MGMLNAKHKFFLPQSATTFFNITSITVGVTFAYLLAPEYIGSLLKKLIYPGEAVIIDAGMERAIIGMSFGTLVGGLVQWLIQMPTLGQMGFKLRLDFGMRHPDLIKVLKLTLPAIIGGAAVQINVLVNQNFASGLGDGAISYLGYAFRLMQLPLGIFGVAIATASAPTLVRMISDNRHADFKTTLQSSLKMSLFLSLPSTVGLMVLAEPIVSLIFEHGKFGALDALGTIFALEGYALGIVAYSLIKIYQPAFLAWHDSKTPMIISLTSILSNFVLNFAMLRVLTSPEIRAAVVDFVGPGYSILLEIFEYPHFALAFGTALVATLNFTLLALSFRKKVPGIWEKNQILETLKILMASLVMGVLAWALMAALRPYLGGNGLFKKLLLTGIPILTAAPAYFLICAVLRVEDAEIFLKALRRRLKK
jgi:putative peptidoglycan lipid II flippase